MQQKIDRHVIAAVVATGLLSFCGVIVETAMNITFPTLMNDFKVDTGTVQWMTSIYLLLVAIIVPLSAYFKATIKTKTLFLTAISLFIGGIIIDALAGNFVWLLIGRAIQGIGTGISLPLMFNIILEQVPQSKIGMMMGLGNLITGIAPALGPTFGGVVVDQLGWRWVFYLLLPLLLVSLGLGVWGIRQGSSLQAHRFDGASFALIIVFFTALMIGINQMSATAFWSIPVAGSLTIGLIALVILIIRSLRIADPILRLGLLKNKRFSGHLYGFFMMQILSLGLAFLLPNYIQLVNGNSAMLAGLIVLPAGFAGAICAPLAGSWLDHVGPRTPILTGISLSILSLIAFSWFGQSLSNGLILFIYIGYMAGMGAGMGCVMTSALSQLGYGEQTQGNAIMTTLQQFAGALGTNLVSMIVAASQIDTASQMARTTAIGTQHALIVLMILSISIGIVYFISIPKGK